MTSKNKGFTLIELAIVIAVIGIIISMVFLSGGALFQSSKTAQTIAIVNDLGEAISQFKNTYKSYPGDMLVNTEINAVNPLCRAGGDNAGNNDERIVGNERLCVIEHLFRAGLIKSDGISADGLKVINSPFGGIGTTIIVSHPSGSAASSVIWGKYVPVVVQISGLPCDVIGEIDRKIDDGILNDGYARLVDNASNLQTVCSAGNILVVAL